MGSATEKPRQGRVDPGRGVRQAVLLGKAGGIPGGAAPGASAEQVPSMERAEGR